MIAAAGGRCRHVGSRCFSIAVVRGILSLTLERGGRSMQVVAKTGFTVFWFCLRAAASADSALTSSCVFQ